MRLIDAPFQRLGVILASLGLIAAPAQGISPIKLNPPLAAGSTVFTDYLITPDGSAVIYTAILNAESALELFRVPISEGTPVKLNGTMIPEGNVASFTQSPDGSRVVYRADADTDQMPELYSVPATGGPVIKLNDALGPSGAVGIPRISPDSSRVIYHADRDIDQVFELYSVPITGGPVVELNGLFTPGGSLFDYRISPDSSYVVYHADQNKDQVREIFSVPIAGGPVVQLNGTLAEGGAVRIFDVSPDGTRVVYIADQLADEVFELFSVPITGGTPVKLHADFKADEDVTPFTTSFRFSPDSTRVVYRADQDTDEVFELYSVPVTGGTPVKLSGAMVTGGDVPPHQGNFRISPDSTRVVYLADQDIDGVDELFSVPITGGTAVKLNPDLKAGERAYGFAISPDSGRVLYHDDHLATDKFELYSVKIGGGTAVKLNAPLLAEGDVYGFAISPDSNRVSYMADQDVDEEFGLFGVDITGGPAFQLNNPLVTGGFIGLQQFSPDSNRVVYLAEQDIDGVKELFSVSLTQADWQGSGGDWDTPANWDLGAVPGANNQAIIGTPSVVTMTGGAAPRTVASLTLGGGSGTSALVLRDDAVLTALTGIDLSPGGVFGGDGVVSTETAPLDLPAGAEIRVAAGEELRVSSGPVTNAGRLEALGLAPAQAELEFSGAVTNAADTGLIAAHDSILRFSAGLTNEGTLSLTGGRNDVFGDIANSSSPPGSIVVSGDATAFFWDDVANDGLIQASASGSLQSLVVFSGSFTGNGVSGGGHVFLEGDARPGFSPGIMAFGGDLSYGLAATLHIEIGGTTAGTEHDQLVVTGHLAIDGTLDVTLVSGFIPAAGDRFDLWDASTVSGAFHTAVLPPLPAGLFWNTSLLYSTGEIVVSCVPETFAEWQAHFFTPAELLDLGVSGPGGDADFDRVDNRLEYLLASDPRTPDAARLPTLGIAGIDPHLTLSFTMPELAGSDLQLRVQASTTLETGSWNSIATRANNNSWSGPATVTVTPLGGGKVQVTVDDVAITGSGPRRFLRLRATLSP